VDITIVILLEVASSIKSYQNGGGGTRELVGEWEDEVEPQGD
jgi:hypothetical protein